MATAAIVRPYNPLTPPDFSWAHAVWLSDPKWAHPANGAGIPSLRNQSGGGDPAQATGANQPLYQLAGINSRPSGLADGSNDRLDVDITDIVQPFKLAAVFKLNAVGVTETIFSRGGGGAAHGFGITAVAWISRWLATAAILGGVPDTNPHTMRLTANNASSSLVIDGGTPTTGTAGTGSLQRFTLFAGFDGTTFSQFMNGHGAFFGAAANTVPDASIDRELLMLRRYYNF